MADTLLAPTSETQVESTPLSPQDQSRQALYEQYYGTPAGGENPPTEQTPSTESTAQVEPTEPVVTPPVATLPPEVLQLMQSMQAELAEVKAKLTPTAPVVNTEHSPEPGWISLLKEGRIEEAQDALASLVAKKNQDVLLQQGVAQTRELMRAENEIDRFTTDLRSQNPELVPMEKTIAVDAQERMAAARNAGLIKTTDDAIRIYKESVTEAVKSARKLYLLIRGEGKQEAQVRQREVLSSRPMTPQATDTNRPQATGQEAQEPPVETPAEYLEKRRAVDNWRKGLAPKPNFIP